MALKNLIEWNKERAVSACGSACGAADKPAEKPSACGSACGAADQPLPDGSRRSVCRDRFRPFLRARPIPDIQRGPAK